MIKVTVKGRRATAVSDEPITTGSVGIPVRFSFDDAWDGLGKVAVFRNPLGEALPDMMIVDGECTVPPEALLRPNEKLLIGIYGTDGENVVIPTIYAVAGLVLAGADPSKLESEDWTPSLAEQVLAAAEEAVETANSVREDADAGAFVGPPGPRGGPGEKGDKGDPGTYIIPATYANGTLTCTANYGEAAAAILNGRVPVLRVTISDGDGQVLDLVHSWQRPSGLLPEIHFAGEDEEGQKVDAWVSPTAGWNLDKKPLVTWGEIQGDLSDQTDLQNTLNAKYDFQEDGIPAEDLDADVQETLGKVDSKAGLLRDTASGDIVSIVPDATVPKLLGLTAAINPVQDLHGYENPWPGGGGKNLFQSALCANVGTATNNGITFSYHPESESFTVAGTATGTAINAYLFGSYGNANPVFTLPAGTYTFSVTSGTGVVFYSYNGTTRRTYNCTPTGDTYTFDSDTPITAMKPINKSNGQSYDEDFQIQIEQGSAKTSWEPYENLCPFNGWTGATIHVSPNTTGGTTYSITFPTAAGTVYGSTIDVVNGVLTVTDAMIASYNGETLPGEWISDRDAYAAGTTPTTGAQVVYKLATPITYQLTAQEIATLSGRNYVWADCGPVTVTYAKP